MEYLSSSLSAGTALRRMDASKAYESKATACSWSSTSAEDESEGKVSERWTGLIVSGRPEWLEFLSRNLSMLLAKAVA